MLLFQVMLLCQPRFDVTAWRMTYKRRGGSDERKEVEVGACVRVSGNFCPFCGEFFFLFFLFLSQLGWARSICTVVCLKLRWHAVKGSSLMVCEDVVSA